MRGDARSLDYGSCRGTGSCLVRGHQVWRALETTGPMRGNTNWLAGALPCASSPSSSLSPSLHHHVAAHHLPDSQAPPAWSGVAVIGLEDGLELIRSPLPLNTEGELGDSFVAIAAATQILKPNML